jgi:hypothetical protein
MHGGMGRLRDRSPVPTIIMRHLPLTDVETRDISSDSSSRVPHETAAADVGVSVPCFTVCVSVGPSKQLAWIHRRLIFTLHWPRQYLEFQLLRAFARKRRVSPMRRSCSFKMALSPSEAINHGHSRWVTMHSLRTAEAGILRCGLRRRLRSATLWMRWRFSGPFSTTFGPGRLYRKAFAP